MYNTLFTGRSGGSTTVIYTSGSNSDTNTKELIIILPIVLGLLPFLLLCIYIYSLIERCFTRNTDNIPEPQPEQV
jgi:ABC-type Fe3+-siderophore transport system permease subunit